MIPVAIGLALVPGLAGLRLCEDIADRRAEVEARLGPVAVRVPPAPGATVAGGGASAAPPARDRPGA